MVGLREFHKGKGTDKRDGVEKGDVVIVHQENVKRGNWKMAEVMEVISRINVVAYIERNKCI